MKAMVRDRWGPPEVLRLEEVDRPVPGDNEVLVRVHAASVNALDWHFLRGTPFFLRLQHGLFRPQARILGYDIAGRVAEVGRNAKRFKPGDEVYGGMGFGLGGFAEYACLAEDGSLALKPDGKSFEEAAAVPGAAFAALKNLRDRGGIRSGQKVLINGAAGGVGTFSVQIAKSYGTRVTGVCSTQNLDLVRSIGADSVIDYTQQDFTRSGESYDLLLDNVGNRSVADLSRVLSPTGTCVIVGFTSVSRALLNSLRGSLLTKTSNKRFVPPDASDPTSDDLAFLSELLESRKVVSVIDRRYPLSRLPEAIAYLETGHARAKVVIDLESEGES